MITKTIGDAFLTVLKHISNNRGTYATVLGSMIFASTITAVACKAAFKKIEEKHRKEDAEQYQKEFAKKLKELDDKYKQNEYLLKKKINDLCDEFGIDHIC